MEILFPVICLWVLLLSEPIAFNSTVSHCIVGELIGFQEDDVEKPKGREGDGDEVEDTKWFKNQNQF